MNASILAIRLRSMGDVLFTRPAVRAIREAFPDAKITFLTSLQNAPLIQGFRDVEETITLDYDRFRGANPFVIVRETLSLVRRLRAGNFSFVVDFQGFGETAFLSWCTGAAQRWGNVYAAGRKWAYTHSAQRNDRIHPAEWNLSLLKQCGLQVGNPANEFVLPAQAIEEARRFFSALVPDPARPVLFIQPLTSTPCKNWPLDRYLATAAHWRSHGIQPLFGGGPADRPALEVVRQAGFPVSAGAPLLTNAGLMQLSALVLGGDTGLLHLAVAMGKRVVMIKDFQTECYPFRHPEWAATPPAGRGGPLLSIDTNQVIEACARGFADAGVRSSYLTSR
ncbi:MAG TPA: glycosyltransferase family 9 protein [Verrucomicrobiae bacterium]|nr:glycosyltransferase family 9 protein [Verrucomicrobiae bacterium]